MEQTQTAPEQQTQIPFNVPINVLFHKTKDGIRIELRRTYTDAKTIREIVFCAIQEQPIILFPQSGRSRIHLINSLTKMGIIKYDYEKNRYLFLI